MNVSVENIRDLIEEADTMAELDNFKNDVALLEQDIDSLDLSSIFLLIEERYGVKIPDADLESLTTVDAIVAYLAKK